MDAPPGEATSPPLRVCHIVSGDLWAGAEVQVATLASYLAERADVALTAAVLNEGPLAHELRRLGIPVTVIDERRKSSLSIVISLVRWLRRHPADIVHTHRYKETVLGAVAARLAGVPGFVRTVHGRGEPLRGWRWAKFRVYEALDTLALRCCADRIVAVSRSMAAGLEESGYRAGTVVTLHNGVDLRKVRPSRTRDEVRRELGIEPDALLIGTAGRLSPVKGHDRLLRAARLILDRAEARFLIVGDGPLRDELAISARRLGVDHACTFAGERSDVYDLVAAMDVFVLPSLHEGIPMALLEAMGLGLPVVASAVGGVPEVVTHGASGLLVEAGDERALAQACVDLARDPAWARTLARRARRVVEERFSHEQNGRALVDAYRVITTAGRLGPGEGGGRLRRGAVKLGERAVSLLERRRMERIRRAPNALSAGLRSARRILIVCQGNIIRSPFAARLVAQALGRTPGDGRSVSVLSAGLAARPGTAAPHLAHRVAGRFDVDLRGHAACAITPEAMAASDVVFVMDLAQLRVMQRRFPEARAKTFLLSCLAPGSALEVRDPFDGDELRFQTCFAHIAACVRPIVRQLAEGARDRCDRA
jgi:L-malate glycosyltransferase